MHAQRRLVQHSYRRQTRYRQGCDDQHVSSTSRVASTAVRLRLRNVAMSRAGVSRGRGAAIGLAATNPVPPDDELRFGWFLLDGLWQPWRQPVPGASMSFAKSRHGRVLMATEADINLSDPQAGHAQRVGGAPGERSGDGIIGPLAPEPCLHVGIPSTLG